MIDGSKAIWNAVLAAMCNESRFEYYMRCFRIVSGKAKSGDFKRSLVRNCLSHAMKSAKIFVSKHYKPKIRHDIMFWIGLLFSCSSLNELDFVVNCIIVLTNSKLYTELWDTILTSCFNLKLTKDFCPNLKMRNVAKPLAMTIFSVLTRMSIINKN